MEVEKIIELGYSEFETIQMILSKHITTMVQGESHISIKQFDRLTEDLMLWKNETSNGG